MDLSKQTKKLKDFIKENPNPNKIKKTNIEWVYQELIDCITDHNHLYYIESQPIISDFEYDQLFSYLKKIEEKFPYIISWNSPTQKLINQIQDWYKKAEHKMPMLSLENSYNSKDLIEREKRVKKILEKSKTKQKPSYCIEPKFDWVSIELIYSNWIFKKAITRWDWIIWEDVTENVKTIKNIPQTLKEKTNWKISFRWEILISKSELEKINKERKIKWLQIYANTRNLASWSLKQLDQNITASRNLKCFIYETRSENWDFDIEKSWLPTYPAILDSREISEIIKICEDPKTKKNLQKEDIDFDGLVIKVKENNLRETIWSTAHHPRRAIAYKFPAEQISTQIKSIEFQVWRTWIITPLANLEPVNLSGATISRVSLHNFDFINEKDIHNNDFVRIQRSWEVIPYVVWSIKDRRNSDSKKITPPTHCPSCLQELIKIDMHYYCKNPDCPAQIKEKIIRFVSKNCMDIEWVWESIVDILVENKIIKNISDLYKLLDFETERIVSRFPWFADKKISEIKNQLELSKNKEFWRLLNGLWIPWIGKKTAQDISKSLKDIFVEKNNTEDLNLEKISKYLTNPEFLIWVYWIWKKIVDWIINYRNSNLELLKKLEKIWINLNIITTKSNQNNKLSFCITWSLDISRTKIIEKMENEWYIFDSNPNKNTNYILIWEKAWSKSQKAEELWIQQIKWREKIKSQFPFLATLENEQKNNKQKTTEQLWLF